MTSPTGPIAPFFREELVERDAEVIASCWERVRATTPPPNTFGPLTLLEAAWPDAKCDAWLADAEAVAVLLSSGRHPLALRLAERAAVLGKRTYLLGPSDLGDTAEESHRLRQLHSRLLVRRGVHMPLDAILVDRGRRGLLLLSSAQRSATAWALPLEESQGAACFQAFTHLFWAASNEEALVAQDGFRFRSCRSAPFDAPAPDKDGSVNLVRDGRASRTLPTPRVTYAPTEAGVPAPEGGRYLFMPASVAGFSLAEQHATAGSHVVWSEVLLPALVLGDDAGLLMAGSGSGWAFHLRLSRDATATLRSALEALAAQAEWVFRQRIPLGRLRGEVLLADQPRTSVPLEEQLIPVADVQAALPEAATARPTALPAPSPLARRVRYRWQVQPPRAPTGTKPARLVQAWRNCDERAGAQLETLRGLLTEFEQQRKSVGAQLVNILGSLLGFEKRGSKLRAQLDDLERQLPPSRLGPEAAGALLDKLADCEHRIFQLELDMKTEAHKEKLRLEELKQREEYALAVQKATEQHAKLEAQLAEAQQRLLELEKEQEPPDLSPEDRKAHERRLKDQQKDQKKKLLELQGEMKRQQAVKDKPFELRQRPSELLPGTTAAGSGPRGPAFVPAVTPKRSIQVPDRALPSLGQLVEHSGKDYLVVQTWEEVAQGQREAHRLQARLVAPAGPAAGGTR
jgi:hypothetical protein